MAHKFDYDLIVIGSGPGGYVCAIRAAQRGLRTAIVEREDLGGVCLNVGCIPSKALISAGHFYHRIRNDAAEMGIEVGQTKLNFKTLQKWKTQVAARMSQGVSSLLKGNQVDIIRGEATMPDPNTVKVGRQSLRSKFVVLSLGSRPIEFPGFSIDEKLVLSSTGALAMDAPLKSLAIIGGGYIGLEIGSFLANTGCRVTVIEAADSLLSGLSDPECVQVVLKRLKKKGVEVKLNARAESWKKTSNGVELKYSTDGKEESLKASRILLTVGRRPNSDQSWLKTLGLRIDRFGFIETNVKKQTSIENIYAVGDISGQPLLAHKASYEGVLVADILAGDNRVFDAKVVPSVIFTEPEIASVGYNEKEAQQAGYKQLKVGKFPFAANGRAVSLMETDGFIKLIAEEKTNRLLGVHMVGPEVSQLISEAALAIEMGARLEDLALTIHPHPTLGEAVMEAAEVAMGHPLHILKPKSMKQEQKKESMRSL